MNHARVLKLAGFVVDPNCRLKEFKLTYLSVGSNIKYILPTDIVAFGSGSRGTRQFSCSANYRELLSMLNKGL
jgi:hypothetical protein